MDRFHKAIKFYKQLTADFGEPVDLNDDEANAYLQKHIVDSPLPSDTFYVLMNLKSQSFSFTHGTDPFFGVNEITFPYFYQQIAEPFRDLFMTWGEAAYTAATDPETRKIVVPLKQEYRTMIPLRNREGNYYWVTQIAQPLQLDADRNLVSHLNTYRVGIAYEGWRNWAFKGEILDNHLPQPDFALKMDEYIQHYVADVFGERKLEMLQLYAQGNNAETIASKMSISKTTVYTHNKEILSKAKKLFSRNFLTVKEAAFSLLDKGYLTL